MSEFGELTRIENPATGALFLFHDSVAHPLAPDYGTEYRSLNSLFLLAGIPAIPRTRPPGMHDSVYYATSRPVGAIITLKRYAVSRAHAPLDNVSVSARLVARDTLGFECLAFIDARSREPRYCEGTIDLTSGSVNLRARQFLLTQFADEFTSPPSSECVERTKRADRGRHECEFKEQPRRWLCDIVSAMYAESECRRVRR